MILGVLWWLIGFGIILRGEEGQVFNLSYLVVYMLFGVLGPLAILVVLPFSAYQKVCRFLSKDVLAFLSREL